MKQRFLSYSTGLIKQYHPEYDDIKMDECRYNLEGFYLTMTKMVVILPIAFLAGVLKELLILLVAFNFLREPAHGLHATKSWICLLSSTIIFVGIPIISKIITIPLLYEIITELIGLALIILYAPADTKKAPIIKAKNRRKFKITATINCILLILVNLIINDSTLSNIIVFAIWMETIVILPITYKLFHLSYNNYKVYLANMN